MVSEGQFVGLDWKNVPFFSFTCTVCHFFYYSLSALDISDICAVYRPLVTSKPGIYNPCILQM